MNLRAELQRRKVFGLANEPRIKACFADQPARYGQAKAELPERLHGQNLRLLP